MSDIKQQWDDLAAAERLIESRKSAQELFYEGCEAYCASDYERAAYLFHQAAAVAHEQGDNDTYCENLFWEGHCYQDQNHLKKALVCLLRARQADGGDAGVRFRILRDLFLVASILPESLESQLSILDQLRVYKKSTIGDSKSMVLYCESHLFSCRGMYREALASAQEAMGSHVGEYPSYNDKAYYYCLASLYRTNGLLAEARKTLREWREKGSQSFAKTKCDQLREEGRLLLAEGERQQARYAIRKCVAEEKYLGIYGKNMTGTLILEIEVATSLGLFKECREALSLLLEFRDSERMFYSYGCYRWLSYYYASLAAANRKKDMQGAGRQCPLLVGIAEHMHEKARAIGKELDMRLETDAKARDLQVVRGIIDEIIVNNI